jgi:hypothetical protein
MRWIYISIFLELSKLKSRIILDRTRETGDASCQPAFPWIPATAGWAKTGANGATGLASRGPARSEGLVQGDGISGPHKIMQATTGNSGSASAEGATSNCIG